MGSSALTSKRNDDSSRVSIAAPTVPATIPADTSIAPWPRTCVITRELGSPMAIANRPVTPSASGEVRHHAVDAHGTQDEGQASQEREQRDDLARRTDGRVEHAAHRRRLLHRGGGSHARDGAPHRLQERRLGDTGRGAEDD